MSGKTVKLLVPCVHSNGTGKERLLEAIEEAHFAIGEAYEKLRQTAPNGRDYYVYKDNPYERARLEWVSRMQRLHSVQLELQAIAEGIHDLEMEVEAEVVGNS
jgi:uncharacterized protein YecE (DUF72 family)